MKKFLSVVMALAMTLTLVTVGASATSFTDDSAINYSEAVSVISKIGVVNGYTDGSFNPTATLTRGAAAKIICNMILGPTTASALGATSAPFSDVPVSNVFAGYIAYCSQAGIINGYGDGTFKPTATVTGYQFMKMLLGALGYDGSTEGFTGTNWTVAVAKLAVSIGLDDGNASFVGSKAMTREEACLYAFNTLMATEVQYDSTGTSISIGSTTINVGGSKATPVTSTKSFATNLDDTVYSTDGGTTTYTVQFGEEHFGKLAIVNTTLDGRTGRKFSYNGTNFTSFVATDAVLATSSNGTDLAKLVSSSNSNYIGVKADSTTPTFYVNGVEVPELTSTVAAYAAGDLFSEDGALYVVVTPGNYGTGTTLTVGTNVNLYTLGKGVVVNFLDTNDNGKYDNIQITKDSVVTLASTPTTKTSGTVTYVTVSSVTALASGTVSASNVYGYQDLVKNDVVLYHTDGTNYFFQKATSITGTMTAFVASTSATIDGTVYKPSSLSHTNGTAFSVGDTAAENSALGVASTVYYLDQGGYIVQSDAPDTIANLDNVFFVTAAANDTSLATSVIATALSMDGTTQTITVGKVNNALATTPAMTTASYSASSGTNMDTTGALTRGTSTTNGDINIGYFYTYTKETNGSYDLTMVKGADTAALGATAAVSTQDTAVASGFTKAAAYTTGEVATSATTFVVYNHTTKAYSTYIGISNTATSDGAVYTLRNSDGYAIAVVSLGGTVSTASSSSTTEAFITSDGTLNYVSGGTNYYTYSAVVNGEITTINSYLALTKGALYFITSYDTNGYVANDGTANSTTDPNSTTVNATAVSAVKVSNGTMTITSSGTDSSYILNSNVQVFVYDTTLSTPTVTEIGSADLSGQDFTGNDLVTVVKTSSTDSTIAYVYVTLQ